MENKVFLKKINELTKHHYKNSVKFKNIIDKIYNKNTLGIVRGFFV